MYKTSCTGVEHIAASSGFVFHITEQSSPEAKRLLARERQNGQGLHLLQIPKTEVIYSCSLMENQSKNDLVLNYVTIIEASDRIGGRIMTYRNKKEGWYAELGAMRIPSFHKILLLMGQRLGLEFGKFIQDDRNTYYLINGLLHKTYQVKQNPDVLNYPVYDWERGKSASELFDIALAKLRDDLEKMGCEKMMTTYDSYSVKGKYKSSPKSMQGKSKSNILNENSFYYTALTEMLYVQSDISDNQMYYEFKGGFQTFTDAFYGVLNSTILQSAKVTSISQTADNVTVTFQDWRNRGALTDITGDYVLVTTTAKAALFTEFTPPLSAEKMEALRSVHYSSSTKVVLSFSERFWENNDRIKGGKSITDRLSRFIYYPSHEFPGISGGAVLASYTCSDDASLLQTVDEKELQELVLNDLTKIHGEGIRNLYTGGVVKKWGLDPYSHGAFAIFTPFQMRDYSVSLFQNEGRIHFAGEHTARPHGWIETAIKSALRAAEKINNNVH
ncbi:hypothetical protein DNTS_017998 [Danionella cerebrum]|uniref:Amine oxidase domain-containing protein n=1 Tax=Danionella cerebrum TaxID=2873325 RepID=A0A553Q4M8_9TELE|nr:hypothetical protein DNTS_017998 [Danionella translucida]